MAKSRKRRKRRAPMPQPVAAKPPPAPEPGARRTARDERPPAPWGPFPLTEIAILVGLIMLIAGFASGGSFSGTLMIAVGIALAALGGLELAIREHFAGYRSHTALLALAGAVLTAALVSVLEALLFGSFMPAVPVAVGALVSGPAFVVLRRA